MVPTQLHALPPRRARRKRPGPSSEARPDLGAAGQRSSSLGCFILPPAYAPSPRPQIRTQWGLMKGYRQLLGLGGGLGSVIAHRGSKCPIFEASSSKSHASDGVLGSDN